MIETHCSFLIQSPGGRDEGLWCRQWDPSLLLLPTPPSPSSVAEGSQFHNLTAMRFYIFFWNPFQTADLTRKQAKLRFIFCNEYLPSVSQFP